MLDEQIKDDLVLLLKKMNLCSIAREEVCNLLNNERQKPEVIKILRKYRGMLLEEVHDRQKLLDNLDFMIDKLKKG